MLEVIKFFGVAILLFWAISLAYISYANEDPKISKLQALVVFVLCLIVSGLLVW